MRHASLVLLAVTELGALVACGEKQPLVVAPQALTIPRRPAVEPGDVAPEVSVELDAPRPTAEPAPAAHWFFESLSADGKRALLRELDPSARTAFHAKVVEVEGGSDLDEIALPELAKIPAATIGGEATALAQLEWMLASPAFARDIARGARTASQFPFGACGRLAASKGGVISFDAGDWLYVADEAGRVRRRLVDEAAYDPRFTADGKFLLFRRAVPSGGVTQYQLFLSPSDLSSPPQPIPGTAGMRDRFVATPDGERAIGVASTPRSPADLKRHGNPETCVVQVGLKVPFATKRLACLEGGEQLVESVISPRAKWAAISTKRHSEAKDATALPRVEWRLRVVSLTTGKTVRDEPDVPGLGIRAISDSGQLVLSGTLGTVVHDVPAKRWRSIDRPLDLGYRGLFRNDKELVYVRGSTVAVLDVTKD